MKKSTEYEVPDLTMLALTAYESIRRDLDAGWQPKPDTGKKKPDRREPVTHCLIEL